MAELRLVKITTTINPVITITNTKSKLLSSPISKKNNAFVMTLKLQMKWISHNLSSILSPNLLSTLSPTSPMSLKPPNWSHLNHLDPTKPHLTPLVPLVLSSHPAFYQTFQPFTSYQPNSPPTSLNLPLYPADPTWPLLHATDVMYLGIEILHSVGSSPRSMPYKYPNKYMISWYNTTYLTRHLFCR